MTRSECALSPNCCLSAENKRDKKYSRLIDCRLCLKSWHAFCIGYETLGEGEFDEKSTKFVCNKCNFFVNAVADVVSDKISVLLDNLQTKLELKLSMRTNVDLRNEENNNSCDHDQSVSVDIPTPTSDDQFTAKNCSNNNAVHKGALEPPTSHKNINCTTEKENKFTQQVNMSKNDNSCENEQQDKMSNTQYLCSIENELSLADIKFILTDANINLDHVNISEVSGNFKRKKYVEISSNSAITMFKFKRLFNASSLNGTWFLRQTPPKHKMQNLSKNSSTNHKGSNERMNHTHSLNATSRPSGKPQAGNKNFRNNNAPFTNQNDNHNSYNQHKYTTQRFQTKDSSVNQQNRSYASVVRENYGNNNNNN